MPLEIDLGEHGQNTSPAPKQNTWRAPPKVYFGPRDPETGLMAEAPVYVHQEYPRLVYALDGSKIKAKMVKSDSELAALGGGWEKNPGAFGYIGAPSLEQAVQLADAAAYEKAELAEKNAAIALGVAIKNRPGPKSKDAE